MPLVQLSVASVTFISAGLPLTSPGDTKQKHQFELSAIEQLTTLSSAEFIEWWHQLPIYHLLDQHSGFKDYCEQLSQSLNKPQLQHILSKLSVRHMPQTTFKSTTPATYIYGENDMKYRTIAQNFHQFFHHLDIVSIPNTSHLCWFEQPQIIQKSASINHQSFVIAMARS